VEETDASEMKLTASYPCTWENGSTGDEMKFTRGDDDEGKAREGTKANGRILTAFGGGEDSA
jgi:hypothetical protein